MPLDSKFLESRKKSKVKSFFKNVARETLAGDYMPESEPSVEEQQQGSTAANSTEEQDQGYSNLPSDESDSDQEMKGQQGNPL